MFHAEVRGSSPTSANLAPRPSSCRGLAVGGVLAGGVPLWAVSPLVVFSPAVFWGLPPLRFLCRALLLAFMSCVPDASGVPVPGLPPGHQQKGTAAHILCIYSGEIGGGTACAQTHHLEPKTGRLLPTDLHATPLITLPACQPISIRCATWGGGSDEPSELASTSLSTAPHYPDLLCIKSAQTTWLRKATPIHILSVKTIKQALTSRQWQPPAQWRPPGSCLRR